MARTESTELSLICCSLRRRSVSMKSNSCSRTISACCSCCNSINSAAAVLRTSGSLGVSGELGLSKRGGDAAVGAAAALVAGEEPPPLSSSSSSSSLSFSPFPPFFSSLSPFEASASPFSYAYVPVRIALASTSWSQVSFSARLPF